MESIAHTLGMSVLLELHHPDELAQCQGMQTPLWGVNNRNLRTFAVSLQQTIDLLPHLSGKTVVTESGITQREDIALMQAHQVNTFLIGESLMRADDIAAALQQLIG